MTVEYLGNVALLGREITAFLAPSRVSPVAVLPTLDWAGRMASEGRVVASGFTGLLEKEVFKVLARGTSPMVLVNATHRYKKVPRRLQPLLDDDRLLIISLGLGVRLDRKNALTRNQYVVSLASELVLPCINEASSLYPIYTAAQSSGKSVTIITT